MRSKNERQPVVVASTCISLRCNLIIYTYITHIYSIHIYLYLCTAYISSHSKGPEQDHLRNPFVPYVRNSAERSIHNFDSQPYSQYTYVLESVGVFAVFALRWHPWKMSVNLGAVTIICDANRRHPPCMQFLVWVDQNLDRFQPWLRTGFITSRAVILKIF